MTAAGVTRDTIDSNRAWSARLALPYPLLSDVDGEAGAGLGVIRRLHLGAWKVDLFRRSTFLIDLHGVVAAVWSEVKIRGHALEVLEMATSLETMRG